ADPSRADIGFGIEAVELGRDDQGVNCRRRALASSIRSCKQIILPAQCNCAQGAFGGVVVDLYVSVIAIARERVPARQGVANRRRRIRLARKLRQRELEPLAQRSEQRLRPRLAYLAAFFRWPAANLFLNRVQRADSVLR